MPGYLEQLRALAIADPHQLGEEAARLASPLSLAQAAEAAGGTLPSDLSEDERQLVGYYVERLVDNFTIGGHQLPEGVSSESLEGWISNRGLALALAMRTSVSTDRFDSLTYGRLIEL